MWRYYKCFISTRDVPIERDLYNNNEALHIVEIIVEFNKILFLF